MAHATLEIGLYNWGENQYAINLRYSSSTTEADVRTDVLGVPLSNFDRSGFLPLLGDATAYGQRLAHAVFPDTAAVSLYSKSLAWSHQLNVPLRIQLLISPSMPYLHDIRWEALCDPADGTPLFLRDDILFSRYLSSTDSRPVLPRLGNTGLRALAVIANPRDLATKFHLPPLEEDRETERISAGLQGIDVTRLSSIGPATLDNIVDELRQSEPAYDILYIVGHGAMVRNEPRLYLEDEQNDAHVVTGVGLAARLMEVSKRPRLVVLVSCESGGKGDQGTPGSDGALAAIGPRLAHSGIPAVVAMQGRVSVETMDRFLPEFFRTLRDEGQIDLAMARARGKVRHRPDAWMPVLFMRLNTGRLWTETSLKVPSDAGFDGWTALLGHVELGKCTPILGSGMLDHLLGTRREIAQGWADVFRFPLAHHERESLPEVAQYLAVTLGTSVSKNELGAYLHRQLLKRFESELPELPPKSKLTEAISCAGHWVRERDQFEPHRVLANLKCPVYITTNSDRLMEDALIEAGIEPRAGLFRWSQKARRSRAVEDEINSEHDDRPLIYHLLGSFTHPDSIVLSQDEYFEYLVASVNEKNLIPWEVNEALTNSALLFLGFQPTDWDFRVLMQSIRDRGGNSLLKDYTHVSVQIDPEEGQISNPELARKYLQKLCNFDVSRISIYWGSVAAFARELSAKQHELVH